MIVLRREVGDVLRGHRQAQGRTLREISASAAVSLGYLSEVERGEKEASSELLASICAALHLPMSQMLSDVSDRAAESEAISALATLPISQRPSARWRPCRSLNAPTPWSAPPPPDPLPQTWGLCSSLDHKPMDCALCLTANLGPVCCLALARCHRTLVDQPKLT